MAKSNTGWDDNFGDWQGLESDSQHPRYQEIARMVEEFCKGDSVLDVGCGEAVLANYLPGAITYSGLEPSTKALTVSKTKGTCHHATAETFLPGDEQWDAIVFNEMLYYSPDPPAVLAKFAKCLRPNGIIIISIYQKRDSWRALFGSSMTNARCTKLVKAFVAREQWIVEKTRELNQEGAEPWWLLVTRPVVKG